MTRAARRDVAVAIGLVLVAWTVFYPGLLFFHQVVYAGDTFTMDLPARQYLAARLHAGQLPLWYPYDGLGVPMIGSMVFGVFHPFTLLYLVMSVGGALAVSQVLLAGLAVAGAYLLARRLGIGLAGAAVVGLAYGLGGPFVSTLKHVQFATGIAGFPWFLIGVHLSLKGRARAGIALASAFYALAILGGDLQAAYLYGVVAIGFTFMVPGAPPVRIRAALLAGVACLGTALAAVQLLPTARIAPIVYRAHGVAWKLAARWSVHPLRLPALVLGDLLRTTPGKPLSLQLLFGVTRGPWLYTVYLGGLVGLGAVWAIALRAGPRRLRVGLAVTAAILVLLAVGRYGGLYRLLYWCLPGWRDFRFPAKVVPYAGLFLALLGGLGLTRALEVPRRALRVSAILAGIAGLLLLVIRLAHGPAATLVTYLSDAGSLPAARLQLDAEIYLARLWLAVARGGVLALMATGAMYVARDLDRKRLMVAGLLLAAVQLGDLTAVNGRTLSLISANRSVFDQPSAFATRIHALDGRTYGRERLATIIGKTRSLETPAVIARDGVTYLGVMAFERDALVPDLSGLYGIEPAFPYLPSNSGRFWQRLTGRVGEWTLDDGPLYNVGLLITTSKLYDASGLPAGAVLDHLPRDHLLLARMPKQVVRPRVFLTKPRFVPSAQAAAAHLLDPDVRSGRVALVEGPPVTPAGATGGSVEVNRYGPERIEVTANVPAGGTEVLVVNDAWYPGWVATLDGRPTAVRQTNFLVRGILVPPGRHDVVLRYPVPLTLEVGVLVSLAALGALLWLVWPRRR